MANNDVVVKKPTLHIVMGVSGVGKSTVAKSLSSKLDCHFVEADDFHTQQAKEMMSQGVPLTPAIRQAWIDRLCTHLQGLLASNQPIVLAYSGLKKTHRQQFRRLGYLTQFFLLNADQVTIAKRMDERVGHFVDSDFLLSQLTDMEFPSLDEQDVQIMDANYSVAELTEQAYNTCLLFENLTEVEN